MISPRNGSAVRNGRFFKSRLTFRAKTKKGDEARIRARAYRTNLTNIFQHVKTDEKRKETSTAAVEVLRRTHNFS